MMRAMPNRHDLSATSHVILIRYQERDHLGHYKGTDLHGRYKHGHVRNTLYVHHNYIYYIYDHRSRTAPYILT